MSAYETQGGSPELAKHERTCLQNGFLANFHEFTKHEQSTRIRRSWAKQPAGLQTKAGVWRERSLHHLQNMDEHKLVFCCLRNVERDENA